MHTGLALPQYDYSVAGERPLRFDTIVEYARLAERCGAHSVWLSDHLFLDLAKYGGSDAREACYDPIVTLAALARAVPRLRLGTLVLLEALRPAAVLAKALATVDCVSGGRLDVGLGAGWYEAEHEAYAIAFPPTRTRYDLLEDQLAILHGAWGAPAGSTFELTGRTGSVRIEADTVRPFQRPHPPIVLGGQGGPRSARLAATYAAEYNVAFRPLETMRAVHDKVRAACETAGRDPSTLSWSTGLVLCCGQTDAEVARRAAVIGRDVAELRENGLAGSPAEVLEKLGRYAEGGANRFYLQVLDLTDLDHLRLVAEEVLPHAPGR